MKKSLFDRIPDPLIVPLSVGGVVAMLSAMAYFSNREYGDDVTRKPDLVNKLKTAAITTCVVPSTDEGKNGYAAKLGDALSLMYSDRLDFFLENKIAICLDERLARAEPPVPAIYYPHAEKPVIALSDEMGSADNTRNLQVTYLHRFSTQFEKAALPREQMIGHSYTSVQVLCAYCVAFLPEYGWKAVDDKTPALPITPPLSPAFQ